MDQLHSLFIPSFSGRLGEFDKADVDLCRKAFHGISLLRRQIVMIHRRTDGVLRLRTAKKVIQRSYVQFVYIYISRKADQAPSPNARCNTHQTNLFVKNTQKPPTHTF